MARPTFDRQKPLYIIPTPHHFPQHSLRPTPILKLIATFLFLLYLTLLSHLRSLILAGLRRYFAHHFYYHAPLLRQGIDFLLWTPFSYTGVLFWLWALSLEEAVVERALPMRNVEEEERLRERWEERWLKDQENEATRLRAEKRDLIMRGEWKGNIRAGGTDGVEVVKWFS